jgi:RNA polymerase sigma-70 factor (ECF subfamily)
VKVAVPGAAPLRQELEALYRSHGSKVAGYFRRCGVSEAVAVELAQESFINALKGLGQFQGHSKLSTWLWTIARNVLLAHLRSRPATDADNQGEPIDPDTLSSGDNPRLNEVCECVRRGFAAFSADHPERAEVVYLAFVEGWTRDEIAAYLGSTPHAATEYLSQCRSRLRPYIEGCHE